MFDVLHNVVLRVRMPEGFTSNDMPRTLLGIKSFIHQEPRFILCIDTTRVDVWSPIEITKITSSLIDFIRENKPTFDERCLTTVLLVKSTILKNLLAGVVALANSPSPVHIVNSEEEGGKFISRALQLIV